MVHLRMGVFLLTLAMGLRAACVAAEPTSQGSDRGIVIVGEERLGGKFLAEISEAVKAIPDGLWKRLRHAGAEVCVARMVIDVDPEIAALTPPGYPEGTTWKNVKGAFLSESSRMVVAETYISENDARTVKSYYIKGVLFHEFGHAFDELAFKESGKLSSTSGFQDAYCLDVKKLQGNSQAKTKLDPYLPCREVGPEQTFAEAFAIALGQASRPEHEGIFKKSFANVGKFVDAQIERAKIPSPKGTIVTDSHSDRCLEASRVGLDHGPLLHTDCGRAALHLTVPDDADVQIGTGPTAKRWTLSRGKYRHFLVEGLRPNERRTVTVYATIERRMKDGVLRTRKATRPVFVQAGDRRHVTLSQQEDFFPKETPAALAAPTVFLAAAATTVTGSTSKTTRSTTVKQPVETIKFKRTQPLKARVAFDKNTGGVLRDQNKNLVGFNFEAGEGTDGAPLTPSALELVHEQDIPTALADDKLEFFFTVTLLLRTEDGKEKRKLAIGKKYVKDLSFTYTGDKQEGVCRVPFKGEDNDLRADLISKLGNALNESAAIKSVDIVGYVKFKGSRRVIAMEKPLTIELTVNK